MLPETSNALYNLWLLLVYFLNSDDDIVILTKSGGFIFNYKYYLFIFLYLLQFMALSLKQKPKDETQKTPHYSITPILVQKRK